MSIHGTRKISYFEQNHGELDVELTKEDLSRIDIIFPLDAAIGDKY